MPRHSVLAEGETEVMNVRPHWKYLAVPVSVAAVVIAGAVAAQVGNAPVWVDWVTLVVLVAAISWLFIRYLRWSTTRLILTTSRVIERTGIIGRSGREIPLSALSNIGYRQTIFDRLIGCGDVILESAGRDGQEVFPDLPRPATIQNEIYAELDRRRQAPAGAPPPPPAPSIPEQIDQLDQLRQRGVISEEEFAAKKAELLRRL